MKMILAGFLMAMFAAVPVTAGSLTDARTGGNGYSRVSADSGSFVCQNEAVCHYVDADNDGICDYCGSRGGGSHHYGDADGDGICDGSGAGCHASGTGHGSVYGGHGPHGRCGR